MEGLEEDMENRSFLLWSEKRRHYSSCLADLDNFIQSHSISFSGSKFLSRKDMENLHRMFGAIQEGLDIFVRYAEHCDLRVNFDGKTCTLMEPK